MLLTHSRADLIAPALETHTTDALGWAVQPATACATRGLCAHAADICSIQRHVLPTLRARGDMPFADFGVHHGVLSIAPGHDCSRVGSYVANLACEVVICVCV